MKKRIAVIVPGGVGGGHFNQGLPALMNLISGLSEGFDVTVYSLVKVDHNFSSDQFQLKSIPSTFNTWTAWRIVKLALMILKDNKKKSYDLIHGIWGGSSGMLAVALGKWLNRPSVVSLRGGETASVSSISYGYLLCKTKKRRLFRTLRTANKVSVLTQFQIDELEKHGFRKSGMAVIPSGVNMSLFNSDKVKKQFEPPYNFLHVANLTEVKDQETLLKAFRLIRDKVDCQLKIAGADYMNGKIQKLCTELQLTDSVSFLGVVKNTELPQHFLWAHVLLHTSLYESQAVVVVEAMASKVLVCGTNVGLIYDLFHHFGSVSVRDHKELAKKTLSLLENDKERSEKIESAYQWAQSHSIDYTIEQFTQIYNQLCMK